MDSLGKLVYWTTFAVLVLLAIYLSIPIELPKPPQNVTNITQDNKTISDNGYESPIKYAYALFDAPYHDHDYKWIAEHAGLVISFEFDESNILKLKAQNSEIIVLMYKFAGITDESKIGHSADGFDKIPDSWYLRTTSGNKVYDDYNAYSRTHSFFLDYGNTKWRDYAIKDYLDSLSAPFDGLFLDVVYFDLDPYMPQVVDYSKTKYEIALKNYLAKLKSELNDAEKLLIVNGATLINRDIQNYWAGRVIKNMWSEAFKITDGAVEEAFVNFYHWKPHLIWQPGNRWEYQIKALEEAGTLDKYYIALSHNRGMNRQDTLYNVGSYLLGMNDKSFFLNLGKKGYRLPLYKEEYEAFKDIYEAPLGNPTSNRYMAGGMWKRDFENGVVIVDTEDKTAKIILSDGTVLK